MGTTLDKIASVQILPLPWPFLLVLFCACFENCPELLRERGGKGLVEELRDWL